MLINSLGLKNFKCFEKLDVKFAPITLLTGANSSGKSSLINAILAVLQTEGFPFYLSPNGKYVNMGGFEEMVFNKNIENNVSIDAHINNFHSALRRGPINFKTNWSNDDNGLPELCNMTWKSNGFELTTTNVDDKYILSVEIPHNSRYSTIINDVNISDKIYGSIFNHIEPKSALTIEKDGSVYIKDAVFASKDKMIKNAINPISRFVSMYFRYINSLRSSDRYFNYVGSFRLPPERTYYQKAKASEKVLSSGEGYIDQIIEWEENSPDKFNELNTIMKSLNLFDQIQSSKIKGGRFELNISTRESKQASSLTDVGFGVSQFLPIIVADLQMPRGSCLAISQPEIHLHPKIQASFGNYISNQIRDNKKQYIIETHSEYLLNRIRLLLVTGELKPEDVCVLYFENDGVKSTTHTIEFATDGSVKGAPESFFDTYGIDVMNIAMEAIK